MKNKQSVLSISGGMDSTALLLRLLRRRRIVHAISFDYGQKHNIELKYAATVVDHLRQAGAYPVTLTQVDLRSTRSLLYSSLTTPGNNTPEGFYEESNMKATVVPNRNAIFSSIIFGYALSIATMSDEEVEISLAVHKGDHAIYPDCRSEFFERIHSAFQLGNWGGEKVICELPYLEMTKAEILTDALLSCDMLGLDFDFIFKNTNTSYSPNEDGTSDGKTGSDIERILAFHEIGREDPFKYTSPWKDVLANALEVERRFKNG